MTPEQLDRLASLIAKEIERSAARNTRPQDPWVRAPVRPEPPARGGAPAPWTGAGQSLGDVAPIREPSPSAHRADVRDLTMAVRAAAAGKGPQPAASHATAAAEPVSRRRARALPIPVEVGVSRRHIHLSADHERILFGAAGLTSARALKQPGQFAANESVNLVGPKGRIDGVRVVGPARGDTQVELAISDAGRLGIDATVAASGSLGGSTGGITLIGPHGRVTLASGVIVAARHLHCAPGDAQRWGLADGDRLDVRCGAGARAVTLHDVLVRTGPSHATELHLDEDEARAAGVSSGARAEIIAWRGGTQARRTLVTERDVVVIAASKGRLPESAILTPSARDRARALGLLES